MKNAVTDARPTSRSVTMKTALNFLKRIAPAVG
jgi:hypothetical protein